MRLLLSLLLVPAVIAELPWAEAQRKLAHKAAKAAIDPDYGHKPTWVGIHNEGLALEKSSSPQEAPEMSDKEVDGVLKHMAISVTPESPQNIPTLRGSP